MTEKKIGTAMHEFMTELYPLCRSITGNGVRETLRIISREIPIEIHEVPTGTRAFDWTVPREWNIRDAYIKNSKGERVVDFKKSNLHVVSYSVPVKMRMPLDQLMPHLFTLPDQPDWIPYLTSYYKEDWGFCLSHNDLLGLRDGEYEVCIDSSLTDGHLTYGEYYKPGATEEEILLSCYTCHPSLCNDNLSGIVLLTFLAKHLKEIPTKYSYRFLFIPETIGALAWLQLNEEKSAKIKHGLVATCVGDPGPFTYKKSRRGNAEIDRAVLRVLKESQADFRMIDFYPSGSDERQFSSPGFNLPVGSLMRTKYDCFPEYHTSADNPNFVQPESLADSLDKYLGVIKLLEENVAKDKKFFNLNPKGEPQLGRRGLMQRLGGAKNEPIEELAIFWVLNLSDGNHTLLDISDRSEIDYPIIQKAAEKLVEHDLLRQI